MRDKFSWVTSCILMWLVTIGGEEVAAGQSPTSIVIKEPLNVARALFEQKKYDEAQVILQALGSVGESSKSIDQTEVTFLLGQIEHVQGRYQEAIKLYQSILNDRPGLLRVRLELADAYRLAKKYDQAEYHFGLVARTDIPMAVRHSIQGQLIDIENRQKFSTQFSFSIIPDTNVNSSTSSETVDLFGVPFDLDQDARKKTGVGVQGSLYMRYRPPISKTKALLIETQVRHTQHKGSSFDDTIISLNTGPRFRVNKANLGVYATGYYRHYGRSTYNYAYGATVRWDRPVGKKNALQFSLTGLKIQNEQDANRNSKMFSFGGLWRRGLGPSSYLDSYLDLSREKARAKPYSSYSMRIGSGFFHMFSKGLSVYLNADYSWRRFDETLPIMNSLRIDHRFSAKAEITKRDFSYLGFAPVLGLGYEKNYSSIGLYDFSRLRLIITATRTF